MTLPIATLQVGAGALGIAPCPGTGAGLAQDVGVIRDWGADTVLSLIEPDEYALLGAGDLASMLRAAGIAHHALPIPDFGPPGAATLAAWQTLSPVLHRQVRDGARVLIHCRAGLGRSGTMAAQFLIEQGMGPDDAIATVRAVRPGAIETAGQEAWLRGDHG